MKQILFWMSSKRGLFFVEKMLTVMTLFALVVTMAMMLFAWLVMMMTHEQCVFWVTSGAKNQGTHSKHFHLLDVQICSQM